MMQQIFDKNNAAVEHLCHGRYKEARKAFKAALLLHGLVVEQQASKINDNIKNAANIQLETCPIPESTNATSPSLSFYMYRHAFLISTSEDDSSGFAVTETSSACLTAVLTFNLSLAYHIECDFECYASNPVRVLEFYKRTLKAIQMDSLNKKRPLRESCYRATIAMGAFMNMGAIFYEEGKLEKVENCFGMILKNKELEVSIRDNVLTNLFLLQERMAEERQIELCKEQERKLKLKELEEEYYKQVQRNKNQKDRHIPQNFIVSRTA
eukprot:CAMPEP_0194202934 /NCGR_PEP_ID=MMETSP0156-20130528/2840_1 /TAXON_ID=33649 /ORGANISM="Thalassionema nitzschioides, Strain L26-B" /LENGTH=267 /DNA_ID=CAMNT_0038928565 /DNA_START=147 /DNA_END=950 /DNA_ORIENTATION=+